MNEVREWERGRARERTKRARSVNFDPEVTSVIRSQLGDRVRITSLSPSPRAQKGQSCPDQFAELVRPPPTSPVKVDVVPVPAFVQPQPSNRVPRGRTRKLSRTPSVEAPDLATLPANNPPPPPPPEASGPVRVLRRSKSEVELSAESRAQLLSFVPDFAVAFGGEADAANEPESRFEPCQNSDFRSTQQAFASKLRQKIESQAQAVPSAREHGLPLHSARSVESTPRIQEIQERRRNSERVLRRASSAMDEDLAEIRKTMERISSLQDLDDLRDRFC